MELRKWGCRVFSIFQHKIQGRNELSLRPPFGGGKPLYPFLRWGIPLPGVLGANEWNGTGQEERRRGAGRVARTRTRSPSSARSPPFFGWEGSPTKMTTEKSEYPYSNLLVKETRVPEKKSRMLPFSLSAAGGWRGGGKGALKSQRKEEEDTASRFLENDKVVRGDPIPPWHPQLPDSPSQQKWFGAQAVRGRAFARGMDESHAWLCTCHLGWVQGLFQAESADHRGRRLQVRMQLYMLCLYLPKLVFRNGCGSNTGAQGGTLVNGNMD